MASKKHVEDIDFGRLSVAVEGARLAQQKFREKHREMIRQYVGYWWGDFVTEHRTPVNLIALYVSVMGRNLFPQLPRAMYSTDSKSDRPAVKTMEAWSNDEFKRMGLESTIQQSVLGAMFTESWVKVSLATPAEAANTGWQITAGRPTATFVSLDDRVFDNCCSNYKYASFIGHRMRVPLDAIRDDSSYHKSRKDLVASDNSNYNRNGDEKLVALGRGGYDNTDEFEEHVDIWELFLPRYNSVVTIADQFISGAPDNGVRMQGVPLKIQPWVGPPCGPMHVLQLGIVPDNPVGKGPIMDLMDLHEAENRTYRKAINSVDRMKEITLVMGGADADGNRVMKANDGDMIALDNTDKIKTVVYGGSALQAALGMATNFKDVFAYMAGNLDMLGGLSPQSKTATQDKLLAQNASQAVIDMQMRTMNHVAAIMEANAWYFWKDPFKMQEASYSPRGLPEMSVERKLYPASHPDPKQLRRTLPWEKLRLKVDPYTYQHSTPAKRASDLMEMVTQVALPLAPILQQNGVVFNVDAFLKLLGQYKDNPDFLEVFTLQEPATNTAGERMQGEGGMEPPGMPANTNRTYTRENVSEKTRAGQDKTLVNSLVSGKAVQPAERNPATAIAR